MKRCMWAYATKRRCGSVKTAPLDRPKTRAYYCPKHMAEAERIYAGSGR